ncbi:MAG: hypothetical protein JWM03_433 [Rhodocyclales bacterium]|nr:hypothetical protein [Rhodocyclales bacterium]
MQRQGHRKTRAYSGRGINADAAAKQGCHQSIDDGQPQSGTALSEPRGEEGVEDAAENFRRNATPIIADTHFDVRVVHRACLDAHDARHVLLQAVKEGVL